MFVTLAVSFLVASMVGTTCGIVGSWMARQKGRWGVEGFVLGALFGPLGLIIEGLLPVEECDVSDLLDSIRYVANRSQHQTVYRRKTIVPLTDNDVDALLN